MSYGFQVAKDTEGRLVVLDGESAAQHIPDGAVFQINGHHESLNNRNDSISINLRFERDGQLHALYSNLQKSQWDAPKPVEDVPLPAPVEQAVVSEPTPAEPVAAPVEAAPLQAAPVETVVAAPAVAEATTQAVADTTTTDAVVTPAAETTPAVPEQATPTTQS